MKRVLVTGGAGFISSNFICHLLEETEHEVVTLDALTYAGNLENLSEVMSHPRLSFVHGDGHASRDWLYVGDDAEAIQAVIDAPLETLAGEVINVATGIDITVAEIAGLVLDAFHKPRDLVRNVPERLGQVDRHIGSTAKAERLLGWKARTSFEEGLERTVAWYRDNEAWWRAILAREARAYSSSGRAPLNSGCSRRRAPAACGSPSSTAIRPRRASGTPTAAASSRPRTSLRSSGSSSPSGSTGSSRRGRTSPSPSLRASPRARDCRIRARRPRRSSPRTSCPSASGSPRRACRSRARGSWAGRRRRRRSTVPSS